MRSFAIIGTPLEHTLSPTLHNHIFGLLGKEAHYKVWDVPPVALDEVAFQLREGQLSGINITLPYKSAFLPYLDDVAEEAKLVGAVNCVSVERGTLLGYNTDITGIIYALKSNDFDPKGRSVLILGNGGSARAALGAFQHLGAKCISIASRREDAASRLINDFNNRHNNIQLKAHRLSPGLDTSPYHLIVNATPVGMLPELENTPLRKEQLHSGQTVFDFIYYPEKTYLQKLAMEKDCQVIGGIDMFIGQGLASLEHWFPGLIYGKNGELNHKIHIPHLNSILLSAVMDRENARAGSHYAEIVDS
ncbi:shikimate dehydrogenase [Candidatus Neomarinimicrobiota bacterium]